MNRNIPKITIIIFLWFFFLFLFLFDIQIVKHKYYFNRSLHIQKIKTTARRGTIFDRKGKVLAGSYEDYTGRVAIDFKNYVYDKLVLEKIGQILKLSETDLKVGIKSKKAFFILKEKTPIQDLIKLENLNVEGLILEKGYKRVYPYEELLSHIIGWIGWENDGVSGLEYFFNDQLKGRDGEKLVMRDSKRQAYDLGEEIIPLIPGKDIQTTLDISLQYMATKALKKLKEKIEYEWGAISVINPNNGEVLAHSIYPPFDPLKKGYWQDEHLASSYYEPGSILKPFFADTALRLGIVKKTDKFDCSKGYIEIEGIKINDHRLFEILNFDETLTFSSNVGCILWSRRIPSKEFVNTIENYGFLKKTGIEIPAEVKGRLESKSINKISQAYITLGQGISVTSAQILRAYSALINGGYLVKPHFEMKNTFKEKLKFETQSENLKKILYQTVIEGTGKKANISFISMGGKTGTAQLAEGGKYVKGAYISSFVCWFPIEKPEYLVLVVIKKPRPLYYGGDVAAPVAREISFYLFLKGKEYENI